MPRKNQGEADQAAEPVIAEDTAADQSFNLDDEGRLPWLEAAEEYDDESTVSPARLFAMVIGGLVLIGAVLGGLWWVQSGGSRSGSELIAAQDGNYKVAPVDDHAKNFEGEGDARFAASEGVAPSGKVDVTRVPEEPATKTGSKPAARPVPVKAASPVKPAVPAVVPATSHAATVQLGAFSSEGSAIKAWGSLTKRFAYLADLGKSVTPVTVGGNTVYRLRVGAGSAEQAGTICAKLKVAGENCAVIR